MEKERTGWKRSDVMLGRHSLALALALASAGAQISGEGNASTNQVRVRKKRLNDCSSIFH